CPGADAISVCAIHTPSCFSRCLRVPIAIGRFYGQSLWIPQMFLLTNPDLHHGLLGTEYTIGSIEDLIKKLLVDAEVQATCKTWIYGFTTPELFIQLLYNIGFVGLKQPKGSIRFKSSEAENPGGLSITLDSTVV